MALSHPRHRRWLSACPWDLLTSYCHPKTQEWEGVVSLHWVAWLTGDRAGVYTGSGRLLPCALCMGCRGSEAGSRGTC